MIGHVEMETPMAEPTSFTPATLTDTLLQTSYAPSHIGTDPLSHLTAKAADKLRALRQRASDLHSVIPDFDEVRTVHLAVIGHQHRISELTKHPSEGGFNLGPRRAAGRHRAKIA
jgi:hypothetical protein